MLRTIIACNLGVILEGFDFVAYSLFAGFLVQVFFPEGSGATAILLTFGTFGVAYVVRPLGGIFWGIYADRHGRRTALAAIAVSMGGGILLIALTPSYTAIGIAAPLLALGGRIIQGFSAGGEFASATALLVESAPQDRRGLVASTQMASQAFTVAMVSGVLLVLLNRLSHGQILEWGWRAVFCVGALIGPLGLYMRSNMDESPEFERLAATQSSDRPAPFGDLFRSYWRQLLCIAGIVVVGASSFYLVLIFLPVYAARNLQIPMDLAQLSTIVSACIAAVVCLFGGALSDRIGRRAVMLPAILIYAIIAYPLFIHLIESPSFFALLVVQVTVSIVLGFISGPLPTAISELLPTQLRSSGLGLVYNIVGSLFGGLGPFFIYAVMDATGDRASPAYWALTTGLIGAVGVLFLKRSAAGPDGAHARG